MRLVYSSQDLGGADQLSRYQALVASRVAKIEAQPSRRAGFNCEIAEMNVGPLRFVRIQSDPVELRRSMRCIEADGQTQYLVGLNLSGSSTVHHATGRRVIPTGGLFLLDKTVPYESAVIERTDRIMIAIPRALLERRLDDPGRYLSVMPATDAGVGRLAATYLATLVEQGPAMTVSQQTAAADMCLDLLAMAFEAGDAAHGDTSRGSGPRTVMLLSRIKAYLRCRLADPDLSPSEIARAHGISKRYLHTLFASTNNTLGAWIREERMARAHAALVDPRCERLSITELALREGFNDIPHFSRQFKARFGMTPAVARTQARQQAN